MSLRIDTTSWIPGALVIGNTGGGVLGSAIPSTGDNGAGYAYNDLSLPADNGKEICGRITTWPTNGTLTAYEDTSFTYDGASDTFAYQLYVDYVAVGAPTTVTLTMIGAATVLPSGASVTASVGTPTAIGGAAAIPATVAPAGVSATGSVGSLIATGASLVVPSGVEVTGAVGTPPFAGQALFTSDELAFLASYFDSRYLTLQKAIKYHQAGLI